MIKIIMVLNMLAFGVFAQITNYELEPDKILATKNRIKILDTKELKFTSFQGVEVNELSALAYKENTLYALSDKGILFHFEISIEENKIQKLSLQKAIKLKDENAKKLKKSFRDSEGLVFKGNDLLISFEKKPRVELYSIDGIKIKNKKIHKELREVKNYKSKNKGLESVAYNETYGILTAPEKPLKDLDKDIHTLYTKDEKWTFPASGSITALEFMSKHKVMVLQRKLDALTQRRVITLSVINLKNSKYNLLAKLDTKDGWNIDNFEGLTKLDKKRYLMISDNQESLFQKTLLVLFEVD